MRGGYDSPSRRDPFSERRMGRGPRGDRGDRPQRPITDRRERMSKVMTMLLRHREPAEMRQDGFLPWEVMLKCEEISGRFSSQDLTSAIEWSHDKDSHRRFEMALNLDDRPHSIWIRATARHTNGRDANKLPPGVTSDNREEADARALAAAKRYDGPGSEPIFRERHHRREHHERYSDRFSQPRREISPVPAGRPVPPEEPVDSSLARHGDRPRLDITKDVAPPSDLRGPKIESPMRSTSDQSTTTASSKTSSDLSEDSLTPPTEAKTKSANKVVSASERGLPSWAPEDTLCIGEARGSFNGEEWMQQHPDDCNHYISFKAGQSVARLSHEQDTSEEQKEETAQWLFGVCEGSEVQGWFPAPYVFVKER